MKILILGHGEHYSGLSLLITRNINPLVTL